MQHFIYFAFCFFCWQIRYLSNCQHANNMMNKNRIRINKIDYFQMDSKQTKISNATGHSDESNWIFMILNMCAPISDPNDEKYEMRRGTSTHIHAHTHTRTRTNTMHTKWSILNKSTWIQHRFCVRKNKWTYWATDYICAITFIVVRQWRSFCCDIHPIRNLFAHIAHNALFQWENIRLTNWTVSASTLSHIRLLHFVLPVSTHQASLNNVCPDAATCVYKLEKHLIS